MPRQSRCTIECLFGRDGWCYEIKVLDGVTDYVNSYDSKLMLDREKLE